MDPNLSRELPVKRGDRNYPSGEEIQMYTNERHTKKDSTKKKIRYKKGATTDDQFPTNSTFQIPEKDKNRHQPFQDDSFGNSSKYVGNQYINPEQLKGPSFNKNTNPSLRYDQNVNYLPSAPFVHSSLRNERFDNRSNSLDAQKYDKERTTNQVPYNSPTVYTNSQETSREEASQNPGSDLNKNASLICRAINNDGKPVTVNDQVIKDKLILSCRPRTYYGPGGYLNRTVDVDRGRPPNYLYPPPPVSVIDNITNVEQTTDINIHQYQQKRAEELEYFNTNRSSLVRGNAYDAGSLGLGDQGLQNEKQSQKYEEQYRTVQCKRYMRTFKTFLWGLFLINLFLLVTGIVLLVITLVHALFKPYINTVIEHNGFTTWIWAAFALSLLIIMVAAYGIATSLNRARKMLFVYCILALILIIIIVIYLLVFWLVHSNLKKSQEASMAKTFNRYRCQRWVRVAWDDLHEEFECCGIEAVGDWKYIPPSCCHAENKYQKLRCISHFISEDQAFKGGCRTKLEDYFATIFLLITCLLVLAIILLLLGILAALRLMKMYKILTLCREMYMITP